ncbi:response regulator transcription factor [Clostridium rectalis]|uniref:response regulator transcription factor n=1 Tax=Clostridium rectalis TaxID=2040295 RepID=UPI000F637DDE|nr:response regulator transcription factor [Clostridium rectalis]
MSRILLVEDDEGLALGMEFTLKDEGFSVNRSSSVKETLEKFKGEKFDIVILDIMLPDGTGYDICKYIRKESDIPIIFLTACDDEVNVVLGLDIGGDDYITKPFRVKEFISRIKAIQRRFENRLCKKTVFISDDIILNTENALVKKDGHTISLSSQEYKLLLIFMNNANKIMSREEILDKLMEGAGSYFDTNTLSVYIKRIREKIEKDSAKPRYIITKRGLGYQWNIDVKKG